MRATAQCIECGRVFNLADELDADEWYSGHDCEVWPVVTDGYLGGDETIAATQEQTEEDEWCEENGHQPGCPHDPTDWDAWNKEHLL